MQFLFSPKLPLWGVRANGVRYLRVGGTRQRYFAGTNSKPHKLLENAATPTRRVHAVLGAILPKILFLFAFFHLNFLTTNHFGWC